MCADFLRRDLEGLLARDLSVLASSDSTPACKKLHLRVCDVYN